MSILFERMVVLIVLLMLFVTLGVTFSSCARSYPEGVSEHRGYSPDWDHYDNDAGEVL